MPEPAGRRAPADQRGQGPGDRADHRVEASSGASAACRRRRRAGTSPGRPRPPGIGPEGSRSACPRTPGPRRTTRPRPAVNRPPGSARLAVRRIEASRSRSSHWFSAPAPPATSAVPRSVDRQRRRVRPAAGTEQDSRRRRSPGPSAPAAAWSGTGRQPTRLPSAGRIASGFGYREQGLIERCQRFQATASQSSAAGSGRPTGLSPGRVPAACAAPARWRKERNVSTIDAANRIAALV